MPYRWTQSDPHSTDASFEKLDLWPYRSLSNRGFVWVISITAIGLCLPLLAVLGNRVLWGLLPFALLVIWALWFGIRHSYRSGWAQEHLILTRDLLTVTRKDPGRPDRVWQANPYWLRVRLRRDGPVENYLTLTDGQREIELGAFLAPEERVALRAELERRLANLR